jgi:geranylgeranyl diphosphate synthase type II
MHGKSVLDLKSYLHEKKTIVDKALGAYFPEPEGPASEVIKAMKYSLFAGGKRLRPILCLAGTGVVGGTETNSLPIACALELIHTYSLIHDDLPIMDDDDFRRGKPTNHKIFGEALALLAGDGLLTEAFHLMAQTPLTEQITSHVLLRVIEFISQAAGYRGMVGGQTVDIQSEGKNLNISLVEFIHTHKTGALITASVTSGAMLGAGNKSEIQAIRNYGQKIGLAFQISDDILDIEGNSETMGKKAGADKQKGKMTYPSIVGLSRSKGIQTELAEAAVKSLREFDHKAEPLRQIAMYIIERKA